MGCQSVSIETLIETEGLSRHFGAVRAVDGLDLRVSSGQIVGLVGPDGAGKTTTMRLLCGALTPSAGQAVVAGFDLRTHLPQAREVIGYVPQRFSLYGDLTPLENLRFFAEVYGVPAGKREARARELLEFVNLTAAADRLAAFLSGGMKQKLSLACALVHRPRVLLLDEPTGGVDPVARQEFWHLLYQLLSEGSCVLISTPYMDEAVRCNHVIFLHSGRVLVQGVPQALMASLAGQVLELVAQPQAECRRIAAADPDVVDLQVFGERLHLRVKEAGGVLARLPGMLSAAGIHLERLGPVEPTLEDVYMAMSGGA
jgi:ABC-2 type transport system ATP-binding protein